VAVVAAVDIGEATLTVSVDVAGDGVVDTADVQPTRRRPASPAAATRDRRT